MPGLDRSDCSGLDPLAFKASISLLRLQRPMANVGPTKPAPATISPAVLAALRAASSRPLRSKIVAAAGPPLALRPSGCAGPAPAMDGPP